MSALACKDVDEQLIDYLYDELDPAAEKAIAEHVEGCARCQGELAAYGRVRKAARAMPVEEPAPSLMASLMEAAAAHHSGAGATVAPRLSIVPPLAPEPAPEGARATAPSSAHAAPAAARGPRRWYRHPGFAAAASFLVVGAGTAYFLTVQPSAVYAPPPSVEVAAAPAPAHAAPPAMLPSEQGLAAATAEQKELGERMMAERSRAQGAEGELARGLAAESAARGKAFAPRPGTRSGNLVDPFGESNSVAAGGEKRAGRAAAVAEETPPAPRREPIGQGHWLGKDENDKLAASVKTVAPSAPAASPEPPSAASPAPPPPMAQPAPMMNAATATKEDRMGSQLRGRSPGGDAVRDGEGLAKKNAPAPSREMALDDQVEAAPPPPAKAEVEGITELRTLVASFQANSRVHRCKEAVEEYSTIRRLYPEHELSVEDRKSEVGCLISLRRTDEARREALAMRGQGTPDQRAHTEKILRQIDRSLGIDEPPAEAVASRKAKLAAPPPAKKAPAKPASAVDALH